MQNKVDNVNNVDGIKTDLSADAFQVFDAIHRLMHLFRTQQYRLIREHSVDLTHMEHKVLSFFARNPQSTLSDLVMQSRRDKAQIARLINEIRGKGLLKATPDASDRRVSRLSLTPEGQVIFARLQQAEQALSVQAVQGLTAEQCKQLMSLLDSIRHNLES